MENLQIAEGMEIDSVNGSFYSPGDIIMLNSNAAPDGFLSCNGATITELEYPALYAILGTYYDSALTVCKLPNLNQSYWFFPCSTVGNEASYPVAASSHSHTTTNNTVTSQSHTTPSHTHTRSTYTSYYNVSGHNHNVPGVGANVNGASNTANRSNGSGQGANLAIVGHIHSWTSGGGTNTVTDSHSHDISITTTCSAHNHSHSATLSTSTNTTTSYVLDNVISMRYYIKW
jgi:microcystin-dependent protein